jgi:hypothetical protein
MSNAGRLRALDDILKERDDQDAQWGGPAHDDTHSADDWWEYIRHQWIRFANNPDEARDRFVKTAALALAAIESMDRKGVV